MRGAQRHHGHMHHGGTDVEPITQAHGEPKHEPERIAVSTAKQCTDKQPVKQSDKLSVDEPFGESDTKSQRVADRLAELFAVRESYGQPQRKPVQAAHGRAHRVAFGISVLVAHGVAVAVAEFVADHAGAVGKSIWVSVVVADRRGGM